MWRSKFQDGHHGRTQLNIGPYGKTIQTASSLKLSSTQFNQIMQKWILDSNLIILSMFRADRKFNLAARAANAFWLAEILKFVFSQTAWQILGYVILYGSLPILSCLFRSKIQDCCHYGTSLNILTYEKTKTASSQKHSYCWL